ncbi:MAG: PAS domain-containing protein [Deltaproteobacteria bacterium]|nr:PAS domain-containing protein [Deltaproteobacteria bacterium]
MVRKPTYEELEQRVKKLEKEAAQRMLMDQKVINAEGESAILDTLAEHVIHQDLTMKILWANRAACESAGKEREEILGRYCYEIWPQREDPCPGCSVLKAIETGEPQEVEMFTPDGRAWFIQGHPLQDDNDNIVGGIEVKLEITKRKQAEESVQKAHHKLEQRVRERTAEFVKANEQLKLEIEERKRAEEGLRKYKSIISTVNDPMSFIDRNYIYRTINEAYVRVFNTSREEITERSVAEMMGKDAFDNQIKGYLDECLGGKEVHYQDWFDFPDGKRRFMDMSYYPYVEKDGTVSGAVVYGRDMTELELARSALSRANLELNQVFNSSIPLCMIDKDYNLQRLNKTLCRLFGLNEETIHGQKCHEVLQTPLCNTPKCPMKQIILGNAVREYEFKKELDSGITIFCLITANPLEGNEGECLGIVESFMDVTQFNQAKEEKNKLEARLQQIERLEAIGTLAGGMAHDFNNLLMVAQGNVSLMLYDIDSKHPHYESLKDIEKQIKNGATLTRQLLGYARKGKYDVRPINLNEMVEETSDSFGRTRKNTTIHLELAEDLFAVEADQGQIEQVLLNFCVNATDAMPGGGDLTLKTKNASHEDMNDKFYDPKPGNYVLLAVTDTGAGMDKETQERIFDPFFTTKEMRRGTGLGLASAYGIVKGHGGYIEAESEIGYGTTFSIYLPATEKKVEKSVLVDEQITKGTETILLVDDEEMVLNIGVQMLNRFGYTVLDAKGGREAVEIYQANKDKIDMVILDMIMPDIGGGEAYDRIKEINPEVKVLLSSGYSIDSEAKDILARGCDGFIQKPFTMKELSQSVREVLGK